MTDLNFSEWFEPADDAHVKRERAKARELRASHWWKNVLAKGRCHYCDAPVPPGELTMDHVVPVIRGGKSTKRNVVACCKVCNDAKSYKLPIEWQGWLRERRQALRRGETTAAANEGETR